MLTEKQNFMKTMKGEIPDWVPRNTFASPGRSPAAAGMSPGFFNERRNPQGGLDIWGVEFVVTKETGYMALPKPGQFILDDIRNWRDVIKAPDISGIDWEKMAKKDCERIDREQTAMGMMIHVGYFQQLCNFMGFTNGLCALYEEPEEVLAMCEYMNNFYMEVSRKAMEYYKPDFWSLADDNATATNPFISLDTYRKFFKKYQALDASIAVNEGLPIDMHDCGRCEDFIDDWLEFGVTCWNPAQVVNDLKGIKKKYGNKLVLEGCWDSQGPVGIVGASEELIRSEVRRVIDTFAPGGGFIFWASTYGAPDDDEWKQRRDWITDEYDKYGRTFYNK